MNTKQTIFCGIFAVIVALTFAACDMGSDDGPVRRTTPPEYLTDESRWESDYDRSTGVTISHKVDSDDVCAITVGGTAIDALPAWDNVWKAYATYQYTAVAGKTYVYTFEAWTDGADRTMNVQWYTDNANAVYQNTGYADELATFTITSEPTTYTIKPSDYGYGSIPKSGAQQLEFQCANQTGTWHLKILSITGIFVVVKNITITGITGKTGEAQIYVFDDNYNWVAWGEEKISGNAVSLNLKQVGSEEYEDSTYEYLTDDPWYGSGFYYLQFQTDLTLNEVSDVYYYSTYYHYTAGQTDTTGMGQKYNITSAKSTIPFNQFAEREDVVGPDTDNNWKWTAVAEGTFIPDSSIAYGSDGNAGGRFVGGQYGAIMYSDNDGESWIYVRNPFNDIGSLPPMSYSAIAYGGGKFIAVGEDGKMAYADWP